MNSITHVLCPVDFSDNCRASLRYAAAIAAHFRARLTVVTVDDPLLAEVAAQVQPSLGEASARELRRFVDDTLTNPDMAHQPIELSVLVGKPAVEILRVAEQDDVSLIVMSSQGRSGARKFIFGSTTERVLRETTVPVLVTPRDGQLDLSPATVVRQVNRIIVPVDLSDSSSPQVETAARIAALIRVPLLLVYVLEPVFVPYTVRMALTGVDAARRARAEEQLAAIAATLPASVQTESLILTGDPAEEITKLVQSRHANLIVIGLHSSGMLGARMGSVAYRVLCLSQAPVLALPPTPSAIH